MSYIKSILFLGIIAIIVAICGCNTYGLGESEEQIMTKVFTVPAGGYHTELITLTGGDAYVIDYSGMKGNADILIMTKAEFDKYENAVASGTGTFETVEHAYNVDAKPIGFDPTTTGVYYIVIDNTGLPKNGANSGSEIKASLIVKRPHALNP